MRGTHCDGCVVTALHDLPAPAFPEPEWQEEDYRVLDVLCDAGLVTAQDASEAALERTPHTGLRAVG